MQQLEVLESDVQQVGAGAVGVIRVGFTGTATYRLMPSSCKQPANAFQGCRSPCKGRC